MPVRGLLPAHAGARTTMLRQLDHCTDLRRFRPFLPFLANPPKTAETAPSDRRREPVRDLRGVARRDRQEGAEIEMAAAACQVAEAAHVDERDVVTPAARNLGNRAALHLDRL